MDIARKRPSPAALAIPIMVAAAALIAMTSIIGKMLGVAPAHGLAFHPLQVSAGRFGFAILALLVFLGVARGQRIDFAAANWRLHFLRSLCGWLGVTAMFAAVARMPVADATAISFLSPVVAIVLAGLLLREHVGMRKIAATGLALLGAGMILRPGTDAFQVSGLFALAAAGLMGLEAIFIKRLSDTEPALRILFINNMIGAGLAVAAASLVWVAPTGGQWLLMAVLGTVMVSGQALFIQSMKRGHASLVMPAFYSVLVFAALYDLILFDVQPGVMAVLGAGLIVLSALMLVAGQGRGEG